MRYKDFTLEDIKKLIDSDNFEYGLVHADYKEDCPSVLEIFRFDCEYDDDDVYVCGVYKDERNDFVVQTETCISPLNFGDGWLNDENDDLSIETLFEMILTYAKSNICYDIDFQKRQIDFINDFGKHLGFSISSVTTATGNKYE